MDSHPLTPTDDTRLSQWKRHTLIIGGILVVGLAFRLLGIGNEAPWYDEVITLQYLDSSSYGSFMANVRGFEVTNAPLFPTLAWFWTQWLPGHNVILLRLLSILIGLSSIAVVYVMGMRIAGALAGVTAALLLAVGQTHIYYSQEIRPYALMLFFAALSSLAFVELLRRPSANSPWLLVNVLANAALMFTHLMNWTILLAQGITLWICLGKRIRLWTLWGIFQIPAVLLTYLLVIRTIDPNALAAVKPQDHPIYEGYWLKILRDFTGVFAPDGLPDIWYTLLGGDQGRWPPLFGSENLLRWPVIYFVAFGALAVGAILWSAHKHEIQCAKASFRVRSLTYVLAWICAPMLGLYILTHLWTQMFFSRYIIHCTIPAALLAGYAVSFTPRAPARVVLATSVIVITASVTLLFPGPFRPSYSEIFNTIADIQRDDKAPIFAYAEYSQFTIEYHCKAYLDDYNCGTRVIGLSSIDALPRELLKHAPAANGAWLVYLVEWEDPGSLQERIEQIGLICELHSHDPHFLQTALYWVESPQ